MIRKKLSSLLTRLGWALEGLALRLDSEEFSDTLCQLYNKQRGKDVTSRLP